MADLFNPLDPRITPARPDLAAAHMRNMVQAARYVEGELRKVVAAQAPMRRAPRHDANLDTEVLKGEIMTVYETTEEGWSWGQLQLDNYVGWVPTEALGDLGKPPTHRVAVTRTLVFPGPSIKIPPVESLPFGCRLAISRIEPPFAVTDANGYVPLRHLVDWDYCESDFVEVAERFLGVPYLWGGKTSLGLDCSALVQLAVFATSGRYCPRDSDLQEHQLDIYPMLPHDTSNLQRGDVIFWDGHVAIVRDNATLIHANAYHMAVAIEPIAEAVARIHEAGAKMSRIIRLEKLTRPAQ